MAAYKELRDIANLLRRDSVIATSCGGSGHLSSCLSCAEIVSCLFFNEMSFDLHNPENEHNDEFILSKGHAAPILYSALYRARASQIQPFSLRKMNSPLEGHPVPSKEMPWIKVATGSLGQGLSIGIGMALALKLKKSHSRVFVLMGDSEMSEGAVYEALQLADFYELDNLIAIIDVNGLGQTRETMLGHHIKAYEKRIASFGWNVILVDGHNVKQIVKALRKASKSRKPSAIIARTIKGKGVSFIENKLGWHGKVLTPDLMRKALKEIPNPKMPDVEVKIPQSFSHNVKHRFEASVSNYPFEEFISTREAYGNALVNLADSNPNLIVLDAEVSNSTFSEKIKEFFPGRFVECFIAEQNMIGMAVGLSKKGFDVFASSFAAFLTRAFDQLRMAAISKANFSVCGSHCGVSVGEDGASQMGLEDIAMFRSIQDSIILYPCDAVSTEKLVYLASNEKGIKYIRTTRPKTPLIYSRSEEFPLGDFKVVRKSGNDKIALIGAGITLHESLKAYEMLKNKVNLAVIDLYSIKPLNIKKLTAFVKSHGSRAIITEDHYKEGGIGDAIIPSLLKEGITVRHLYVGSVPHSGTMEQLLAKYRIDSNAIIEEVERLIK